MTVDNTPFKGPVISVLDDQMDALAQAQEQATRAESAAQIAELEARAQTAEQHAAEIQAAFTAHLALKAPAGHPTDEEPPPPPPPPTGLAELVQGTWVLQQVASVAELDRLLPQINAALALPGVVGLSVRAPWDAVDTSLAIFDRGRAIATAAGKEFSIRFMAGAHTPKRVFDAGAAYYTKGSAKVPLPWSNSTGDHLVFLDAYRAFALKLADWCRANDVHLLHLSWWGQDWAELNHGAEVRAASGYTEAKWSAGQKALIDVAPHVLGDGLAVELPLSGYGPLSGGQSAALADHVISKVEGHPDEFFVQANGLGPNGEWGAPSSPVESDFDRIWAKAIARGVQMIQPQDYDWAAVYNHAESADATYVEVYLPSFAPNVAHAAQLRAEIANFKES